MKESISQILVHLDGTAHAAQRLQAARSIAAVQGAAVMALYAVVPSLVAVPFALEGGAASASALQELDERQRAAVRADFDREQAAGGVRASWAEATGFPVLGAFAEQALYADLLVLGQHDGSDPGSAGVPSDFAESVMASTGKPALVLPYCGLPPAIGNTIVVAWKPTREAARAVSAAVPLLQRARRVHVLSWEGEEDAEAGVRGGLDLAVYLKLRGIEATWHRDTGGEPQELGELLLSRAFELEADLLVMGCYGHNRAREWVLGGVSRTLLRSMTLPVLMAH